MLPGTGTAPHLPEKAPALWSAPEEGADRGGSLSGGVLRSTYAVGWEPHLPSAREGDTPKIKCLSQLPSFVRRTGAGSPMQGCRNWEAIPRSSLYPWWTGNGRATRRRQELRPACASGPSSLARRQRSTGIGAHAQAHSNKWPLPEGRTGGGGVRRYPISPSAPVPLSPSRVVPPPLSQPALRRGGKMAAEKQVPGGGGGSSGGGGGGSSGGGRGAGGEENKENERPSAGSKANKEFGDSLSLESILQ